MKPRKTEYEGPVTLPNGCMASDTGDYWHSCMPREFWTSEARQLFKASVEAGLLDINPYTDEFQKGAGITKAQLAYWCIRASTYLGLDRGLDTYWTPFEKVFGTPGRIDPISGDELKASNPLRKTLHDITDDAAKYSERYTKPIDDFFFRLEMEQCKIEE